MRLALVRAGLPEPLIGHRVYDSAGRYIGRPDLAYVRERIAIEYEGDVHRTDSVVFQRDIERRERFEDAGWRVIRVTNADFRDPARFLARVSRVLRERS
jgi:very-short-patch-repair endonuclease